MSARSAVRQENTSSPGNARARSKSKLSELSASRGSTMSQSSGTYTVDSGSVKTYPQLRPSSQSAVFLKSDAASDVQSTVTTDASMEMYVSKAIEIATRMEEMDLERAAVRSKPAVESSSLASTETARPPRPSAPIPEGPSTESGVPSKASPAASEARSKPGSKLSQLAQSRTQRPSAALSQINSTEPVEPEAVPINQPPKTSKLASLAKSRTSSSASASATQVQPGVTTAPDVALSSSGNPASASKLVQPAQRKTQEGRSGAPAAEIALNSVVSSLPASSGTKPASKLSQLAQSRAQQTDRKSTRLNSSHSGESRMPSSA